MTLKKLIVGIVLFTSLLGFPAKDEAKQLEIIVPATPKELISMYARQYGASEKELMFIAKCESGFNTEAIHINDGGKGKHSVGIYQYQESTFNGFDNLLGEDLDYYSYEDQIKLTAYIFSHYPKLKSHWTCYRIYTKTS